LNPTKPSKGVQIPYRTGWLVMIERELLANSSQLHMLRSGKIRWDEQWAGLGRLP
jgi:hypothetical protein